MSGEKDGDVSSWRPIWNTRNVVSWAPGVLACAVLLGAVRYCPSYLANKVSLIQMWVNTFWSDISTQIASLISAIIGLISSITGLFSSETGLFSSVPKETLSGEATASEWNYCLLVPFITAWLVWRLLPRLRELPIEGRTSGYAILAGGFLLYIAGFLMENYYIGMGAMEFVYAGLIVLYLGWPAMKLLFFPWVFLMFMWPYDFMEDVALELRLLMSSMSHDVLLVMAVPNMLQGTAILSTPGSPYPFAIDIADPCSGIRSLFALVMIAAVYAFITFDKLWQQAVIIALAVPLVIAGNLVRIIILALGTIHFGQTFALGTDSHPSWFHEGAGYLVYLVNFGGLILVGTGLERLTSPRHEHAHA